MADSSSHIASLTRSASFSQAAEVVSFVNETSSIQSKAEQFISQAKRLEQESRGIRVPHRVGSGGPANLQVRPLRAVQELRIASSNTRATQKEILSVKALERALDLKVSLLHRSLSVPNLSVQQEILGNSRINERSRANYLENMVLPHIEVARLVENIVMKYNSIAVQWLRSSDIPEPQSPTSENNGDARLPGVDDALGMLLEASKFLQPPILQLLDYERAAAKHVTSSVATLESAKEQVMSRFVAKRLRSRMVYGGDESEGLMTPMELEIKRPFQKSPLQQDEELPLNEDALTDADRVELAALSDAIPIPDSTQQRSILHTAGAAFRSLYKIVADNEEALLREIIFREHCGGGVHLRPPTSLSLLVSHGEVVNVLGSDAAKSAWFEHPDHVSNMSSYLFNKTSPADQHKALRRLQSMDLSQLFLLGLRHDDPTLIATALDGGNVKPHVETNTTSSTFPNKNTSLLQSEESYQSQLFRSLGVFLSPDSAKGSFVNPVALSNLYFTFPMLCSGAVSGTVDEQPTELVEVRIAVSRIVGSILLRLRASTLNNIACVLRKKGEIQLAISFVHAAIQLEEHGHLLTNALRSQLGSSRANDNLGPLQNSLEALNISPHDPTSFLSSVLNNLNGGNSNNTEFTGLGCCFSPLPCITNLSAMYCQLGRYQEATAHAKKAVILFQQQNSHLQRDPPGSEASTIFPQGDSIGIGFSQLENRPTSGRPTKPEVTSQKGTGLGAVIYLNLAMALEPSDPDGCVQAYDMAFRLASKNLGGEWSPAAVAIKNNRAKYLQWLDLRRGVTRLIQGSVAQTTSNAKALREQSVTQKMDTLSPKPPISRNTSVRPSSSRVNLQPNHGNSTASRPPRVTSAPPPSIHAGPNVLIRTSEGSHSFDFSSVKQSDFLLLTNQDDADNPEIVAEIVAPFLGSESLLSPLELQRLRVLNAQVRAQLAVSGANSVVGLPTAPHTAASPNNNALSQQLPVASPAVTPSPPLFGTSDLELATRSQNPHQDTFREPAFSLLVETQSSLVRAGEALNMEMLRNLMASTLAQVNSSRSNPQPLKSSGTTTKPPLKGSLRSPISTFRSDRRQRNPENEVLADGTPTTAYIKEPKAPPKLPKEFFNEVKKGDDLVQFFSTRLNNLLRVEDIVENRYRHAVTIQSAWRSYRARSRLIRLRKYRASKLERQHTIEINALKTIVRFFRALTSVRREINDNNKRLVVQMQRRLDAATALQKYTRRWLAIRRVGSLRGQQRRHLKAVIGVQKQARVWLSLQIVRKVHATLHDWRAFEKKENQQNLAATKIQSCFRSHWARIRVCFIKGDQKGAMVLNRPVYKDWAIRLLQRNVRGFLIRRVTSSELFDRRTIRQNKSRTALRLNSALKISAAWRGYFLRKQTQSNFKEGILKQRENREQVTKTKAVLILQRAVRCMLSKMKLLERKKKREASVNVSRLATFDVTPIPLY